MTGRPFRQHRIRRGIQDRWLRSWTPPSPVQSVWLETQGYLTELAHLRAHGASYAEYAAAIGTLRHRARPSR